MLPRSRVLLAFLAVFSALLSLSPPTLALLTFDALCILSFHAPPSVGAFRRLAVACGIDFGTCQWRITIFVMLRFINCAGRVPCHFCASCLFVRSACRRLLDGGESGRAPARSPCCSSSWGDAHFQPSCAFSFHSFLAVCMALSRLAYPLMCRLSSLALRLLEVGGHPRVLHAVQALGEMPAFSGRSPVFASTLRLLCYRPCFPAPCAAASRPWQLGRPA